MRRSALTVGILLIMVGVFLISQGGEVLTPIAEVVGLSSHLRAETPLVAPTLLTVAPMNYTWISIHLDGNVQVTGAFQVGVGREIDFYVMDEGNFSNWQAGRPAAVLLATLSTSLHNFTLTPRFASSYYFVFENQDNTRHVVIFTLNLVNEMVVIHPAVEYLPYALVGLGILLSAWGLRSGRRTPERPEEAAAAPRWRCRFCGTENPLEQAFCENCGRSQQ
jgi:hypothetical protein